MNMNKRLLLLIALCISFSTFVRGTDYYVREIGVGAANGTGGWSNAMGSEDFSQALYDAKAGDVFYVAAGTYYPELDSAGIKTSTSVLRSRTFTVKSGVTIIGSYKTDLVNTQRGEEHRVYKNTTDGLAPTTIFSGDMNKDGARPAYHIIDAHTKNTSSALPRGTVKLDGLKITGGQGSVYSRNVNLEIINCLIENNRGVFNNALGGVRAPVFYSESGDCMIKNSSFTGNTQNNSDDSNGIINVRSGNLDIFNSTISGNTCNIGSQSDLGNGSAIIKYYSSNRRVRIYNSTISNNTLAADRMFGSLYINNKDGEVEIINSTITNNQSPTGGNAGAGIVLQNYQITTTIIYPSDLFSQNVNTRALVDEEKPVGSKIDTVVIAPAIFKIDNTILAGNTTNDIVLRDVRSTNDPGGFNQPSTTSINSNYKNGDIYKLPNYRSNLPKTSIIGEGKFYNNSATSTAVSFSTTSPFLGALEYNGGLAKTRRLLGTTSSNYAMTNGNTAYNGNIVNSNGLNRDQRGFLRTNGAVSIGAYQYNGEDDGGDDGGGSNGTTVSLNLTVFLQGVTQSNGTMTNYIQTASSLYFSQSRLPQNNPYGVTIDESSTLVSYADINNASAAAGAVVDWIKVEIWSVNMAARTRTVLEERALLLKTNGSIVDIDGSIPKFKPQTGPVRIVVKHRNHLGVMSNEITSFTGSPVYDFSTSVEKAVKMNTGDPAPMTTVGGKVCLWAGELVDNNQYVNINDVVPVYTQYPSGSYYDQYIYTDLNMDGFVNAFDYSFVYGRYTDDLFSILNYFPY